MTKEGAYNRFVKTSEIWLKDLEGYRADRITNKKGFEEWSISELYDHLMRVANTYQIPNFLQCVRHGTPNGGKKNLRARIIFDLELLPYRKLKLENFPEEIATAFTPKSKEKDAIVKEFTEFIEHVKNLQPLLKEADTSLKHKHPMFGWINAVEWFALVEIHIRHHTRQKTRIEKQIF